MKSNKTSLLLAAIAAGSLTMISGAATITIDSVTQRWPWNNKVDITYTVSGGQASSAGVYCGLRFSLVAGGKTYAIEGSSIGASAESGDGSRQHTATWTAPEGIQTTDASLTATLYTTNVPSGNDYMVVDLETGEVCYEGLMNTQDASNSRYNTDVYKSTKMVLRKVPKWLEASSLPNYNSTLAAMSGYPTGDNVNNPYQNKATNWVTECGYYIGIFPVTQSQYKNICGSLPNAVKSAVIEGNKVENRPVENISWLELRSNQRAEDFAPTSSIPPVTSFEGSFFQRLNYRTGCYFDLPTEVMYEIACRAGATNVYWWGNEPDASHIWCKENAGAGTDMGGSSGSTVAVGLKSPNAWGLYDMVGNVCQWCLDDSNVSGLVGYMTSRPDAFTPYCGEFPRSVTADDDANKPKRRSRCRGFWDTTYTHSYFRLSNRGSDNANDVWSNNKGFRVAFIVK